MSIPKSHTQSQALELVAKGLAAIADFESWQRAQDRPKLSFKVAEKGGVSVYGLQRNPVTLYVEQWESLLDEGEVSRLRAFLVANRSILRRKGESEDDYTARRTATV